MPREMLDMFLSAVKFAHYLHKKTFGTNSIFYASVRWFGPLYWIVVFFEYVDVFNFNKNCFFFSFLSDRNSCLLFFHPIHIFPLPVCFTGFIVITSRVWGELRLSIRSLHLISGCSDCQRAQDACQSPFIFESSSEYKLLKGCSSRRGEEIILLLLLLK